MWVKGKWIKEYRQLSCEHCKKDFESSDKKTKFCTDECRWRCNSLKFDLRHQDTRYLYFTRLLKKHHFLSLEQIENLYQEQKGLCALSGVPMTWVHGQGKVNTNISLDRISHGKEYDILNIRLVCTICNVMRLNMQDSELLFWCKSIINNKAVLE